MTATITATKEQLQSIGIEYEITGAMCDVHASALGEAYRLIELYTVHEGELKHVNAEVRTEWLKFEE